MSLMIDLTPAAERRLRDEATRHGIDPKEYARILVEEGLPPTETPQPSLWETASTDDEWISAFDAWVDSITPARAAPIPSEALSRESLYDDRGM